MKKQTESRRTRLQDALRQNTSFKAAWRPKSISFAVAADFVCIKIKQERTITVEVPYMNNNN